jgi:hypothetical protein
MNKIERLVYNVGFVFCSALVVALTGHTTYAAEVSVELSAVAIHTDSDFYEPLSSYGRWQDVGSYGRCWIPGGVDAGWSPYANGYWQQTDAGWYWVSVEPWGWATYHYGRWDWNPQFGWYWVPQTQWAPAWVSWRQGGGYIGWAPLGPSARGVESRGYVFVQQRQFLQPVRPATVIVNNTVINQTVINKGPDTAVIEQASGQKVQAVPVRQLRSQEEAKVVVKRPAPISSGTKAVLTPVPTRVEKPVPTNEQRQVAKPVISTAVPQPPAAKSAVPQTAEQKQVAKLEGEKRAQQEKAQQTEREKKQPAPAAVEAKPETKPEAKHQAQPEAKVESKPVVEQPAAAKEPTERKVENEDEKKD